MKISFELLLKGRASGGRMNSHPGLVSKLCSFIYPHSSQRLVIFPEKVWELNFLWRTFAARDFPPLFHLCSVSTCTLHDNDDKLCFSSNLLPLCLPSRGFSSSGMISKFILSVIVWRNGNLESSHCITSDYELPQKTRNVQQVFFYYAFNSRQLHSIDLFLSQ
jgi:hypothetical protein